MSVEGLFVKVSIDFGTYASGFGWCVHLRGDDDPTTRRIFTFDQWPGQPVASVKMRTALLLDRDGKVIAWGHDAARLWSLHRFDRRDRGWRYRDHFKMALAKDDGAPRPFRSMAMDRYQEDVEDLITKFLRCMRERVLQELGASGYHEDDVVYCLTVPNIWTDRQKAVMRDCALKAGFPSEDGRLILALEPEAAAQHARVAGVHVANSQRTDRSVLNTPGRRFVVADCGGGTADTTSYVVEPSGHMVEVGTVSGEMCGGAFVNAAFEERVLVPRLGGPAQFAKLQDTCPEGIEELLAAWERAKLNVTVDHDTPLYLPIIANLARRMPPRLRRALAQVQDGVNDSIVVSPAEVTAAFEAVTPRIRELVSEQIYELRKEPGDDDLPIAVLLAGGFAASPYLRQSLIDHLGDDAVVVVPPDPQVAIVAGAVHFACRPDTRARRARLTYGISMSLPFREGIDPEDKREVDDVETSDARGVCVDRFKPMIKQGDLVPTGHEVAQVGQPLYGKQTSVDVDFYAATGEIPDHVDSPRCDFLGTVTVNLEPVMKLVLNRRTVKILMRFGETEIRCRVVLVETGQELEHTLNLLAS